MRRLLRAVTDLDMYFMMALLVILTFGTGMVLANPRVKTFDSPLHSWDTFAELGVGVIHPTEEQWGAIIASLALLQVLSMWQLAAVGKASVPVLGLARLTWGLTCALYFAIGASFLLNNPLGLGYLFLLTPGCAISARVCVRVRHLVEGCSGGQGG